MTMLASLTTTQRVLAGAAALALAVAAIALLPSPRSVFALFDRPDTFAIKEPPAVTLVPPRPLTAYDELAARPLFNLDRKPDPATAAAAAPGATTLGDLAQYRLTGVVMSQQVSMALVKKGDASLTLKKGDTFEGWTVDTVDASGVAVSGGGRSELLAIPKAENRAASP